MKQMNEKRLVLLKRACSNWDLFYDRVNKYVKSIATDSARKDGAKDSVYGSVNYFLRMFEWQLEREEASLNELTPMGIIVRDKWIQYQCPVFLDEQKVYWDTLIANEMKENK